MTSPNKQSERIMKFNEPTLIISIISAIFAGLSALIAFFSWRSSKLIWRNTIIIERIENILSELEDIGQDFNTLSIFKDGVSLSQLNDLYKFYFPRKYISNHLIIKLEVLNVILNGSIFSMNGYKVFYNVINELKNLKKIMEELKQDLESNVEYNIPVDIKELNGFLAKFYQCFQNYMEYKKDVKNILLSKLKPIIV